ncbi:hypothetical protein CesoFtcFv8_027650 [Champsocephalus esox]|uniref:Uncharacterized protein n=1 Tax=Champsocephalus esox TaxID=159716 RepID=A0AAN7Y3G0_9TELE|nr:hypothetical protein CesoFtcFv8_027650 [Champsocephalus esox]
MTSRGCLQPSVTPPPSEATCCELLAHFPESGVRPDSEKLTFPGVSPPNPESVCVLSSSGISDCQTRYNLHTHLLLLWPLVTQKLHVGQILL